MDSIVIGKILKPQGIKGEVKVLPITHDVTRFKKLDTVIVGETQQKVCGTKIREDGVYITFEDVSDRNEAEKLRNLYISVPREKAVKPKEGWFIVDLIGCEVSDNNGKIIGTLTDVMQNGCADVYSLDKGKVMFPALKKLLKSVDVENKKIVVDSQVLNEVAVYED